LASRGLNWLGHTKLCNLAGLDQCWLDTDKVDPIKISNKWICIEEFQQLIVMVDMDIECNFFLSGYEIAGC
jgi:hypothetical protein